MIENDEIDELSCPDDLIKYIRPPCHDMDKSRRVINKKFQCLGQLLISCQNRWKLIKTRINKPWDVIERALKPQLRPQWLEIMKLYIHTQQNQMRDTHTQNT